MLSGAQPDTDRPESPKRPKPSEDAVQAWEVLELITGLVDKNLVVFDALTGRYRLLETIREYGCALLDDNQAASAWRSRHLTYFLALAEEAEPHLTGREQAAWLRRLETEHDNLRAALRDRGDTQLRLAAALWRFWMMRGYVSEGRELYAGLLEHRGRRSTALADALHAAGNLAVVQSDYVEARGYYEQAADIRRELGDRAGEAGSLGNPRDHRPDGR